MEKVLELMSRMGEDIKKIDTWEKIINETPVFISEGLLKTYNTSLVINAISSIFKLRKNGKEPSLSILKMLGKEDVYIGDIFFKKSSNDEEEIKIILDYDEKFISVIEKKLFKYGWVLYRIDKNINNKTEFIFEKKFPTSFMVENLLKFTKYIYHQTSLNLLQKINKQGLIPKESKSPGFYNEPRIYFWLNKDDIEKDIIKTNKIITFKVNLEKLIKNHIFYIDNRMINALYTKEPISINALNLIEYEE